MTKIGQATWLCGSLPLGCIIIYLEIHLISYSIRCCPIRETVVDPNCWWYTFDTLKQNEWSVMCGPGCKMFLLNPVYSSLEIQYRQVVPYLVIIGIQSPISARGFNCILYVEREMQAFHYIVIYLYVDIIIISEKLLASKLFWIIVR